MLGLQPERGEPVRSFRSAAVVEAEVAGEAERAAAVHELPDQGEGVIRRAVGQRPNECFGALGKAVQRLFIEDAERHVAVEQPVDCLHEGVVQGVGLIAEPVAIRRQQVDLRLHVLRLCQPEQQRHVAVGFQHRLADQVLMVDAPREDSVRHLFPIPVGHERGAHAEGIVADGEEVRHRLLGGVAELAVRPGVVRLAGAELAERQALALEAPVDHLQHAAEGGDAAVEVRVGEVDVLRAQQLVRGSGGLEKADSGERIRVARSDALGVRLRPPVEQVRAEQVQVARAEIAPAGRLPAKVDLGRAARLLPCLLRLCEAAVALRQPVFRQRAHVVGVRRAHAGLVLEVVENAGDVFVAARPELRPLVLRC